MIVPNNHGPSGWVRERHEQENLGAPHRPLDRMPIEMLALRRSLHTDGARRWEVERLGGSIAAMVNQACELAYVAIGTCVTLGVDFERAFREVHEAKRAGRAPREEFLTGKRRVVG